MPEEPIPEPEESSGTAKYVTYLQVEKTLTRVGRVTVTEEYSSGWKVTLVLRVTDKDGEPVTLPETLSAMIMRSIIPSKAVVVRLGIQTGQDDPIIWKRTWPGFVTAVDPFDVEEIAGSYCEVTVRDVVSYLSQRRIWGGFRGHSAAEMFGGALSMAAGSAGQATLSPFVPNYYAINVHSQLRNDLDFIPYAIATGETLAEWLGEFFGLLGIRMEMLASEDGSLTIILSDSLPADTALEMSLPGAADQSETPAAHGELEVVQVRANAGTRRRMTLLDDPTKGNFRLVIGEQGPYSGPVGTLVTGTEIALEEALLRSEMDLNGRAAELLVVAAESRQPAIRPGRTVMLREPLFQHDSWQTFRVEHRIIGTRYGNTISMMSTEYSWHPRPPVRRPVTIVPAYVDSGSDYGVNQPVPRDSLGRILVRLPFSPTLSWEDQVTSTYDQNMDERITKDDFAYLLRQRYNSEGEVVTGDDYDEEVTQRRWESMSSEDMQQRLLDYETNTDPNISDEQRAEAALLSDTLAREADVELFMDGEFDDPFPDLEDDELDEEQLAQREEMLEKRNLTAKYLAWKRALAFEESGGDYDHDGYATAIDSEMSEELRAAFADPAKRAELEEDARARQEQGQQESPETLPGEEEEEEDLVDEYLRLFGEDADDPLIRMANLQRDASDEQWPPRLPLPVVQPMAGGTHGFVTAHRQGDACRVAVHDVMNAEIIGFQYRSDRDLKATIGGGATAGIVVEHNHQHSWSGIVFRKIE